MLVRLPLRLRERYFEMAEQMQEPEERRRAVNAIIQNGNSQCNVELIAALHKIGLFNHQS